MSRATRSGGGLIFLARELVAEGLNEPARAAAWPATRH